MEEPGRRDDRRHSDQTGEFRPNKKYPLFCVITVATGIDRPLLMCPMPVITHRTSGQPGARDSESELSRQRRLAKFRKLNVRNLGVGDAWDVLSGVDYLIKGWVDKNKVGCMGWSQRLHLSIPPLQPIVSWRSA
jgi:hypothetical protein